MSIFGLNPTKGNEEPFQHYLLCSCLLFCPFIGESRLSKAKQIYTRTKTSYLLDKTLILLWCKPLLTSYLARYTRTDHLKRKVRSWSSQSTIPTTTT